MIIPKIYQKWTTWWKSIISIIISFYPGTYKMVKIVKKYDISKNIQKMNHLVKNHETFITCTKWWKKVEFSLFFHFILAHTKWWKLSKNIIFPKIYNKWTTWWKLLKLQKCVQNGEKSWNFHNMYKMVKKHIISIISIIISFY